MDNDAAFRRLMEALHACDACADRFGFAPRPVVRGHRRARVMQIGQAPSRSVHRSGKPFDDASGRRLRGWYGVTEKTFYDPDCFYLTSMGHCYPGRAHGGDAVPPSFCADRWLAQELALVECRLYVVIGRLAAARFFPGEEYSALTMRTDLLMRGRPLLVLPHPSPRNVRWFLDHPAFEAERVPIVRRMVWAALAGCADEN